MLTTSVVGGGYVCDLTSDHATDMSMSDMPMSDDSIVGMPGMPGMPAHAPTDASGNTSSHHHQDCSLPWSPADCDAMTSCAPHALAAEEPPLAAVALQAHEDLVWRVDQLASVARSPEPPPPRA